MHLSRFAILATLVVVVGFVGPTAHAQKVNGAYAMQGRWVQHFDRTLDGTLEDAASSTYEIVVTANDASSWVARYADGTPGQYTGQVLTARTTSIISVIYQSRDYYAVWAGKFVSSREIVGTWADSAGQSGDFRLFKAE